MHRNSVSRFIVLSLFAISFFGSRAARAEEFKVISKGAESGTYQAFPDACRLANGDIVCVFYAGYGHVSLPREDFPKGGRICFVRSSDEGKTWTPPAVMYDDENDNRDPHIAEIDGKMFLSFFSFRMKDDRKFVDSEFKVGNWAKYAEPVGAEIAESTDGGKTWEKPYEIGKTWFCSAPVRKLPNGSLILGLYGDSENHINHGGSIRSMDGGKTWEPPVTIDKDATVSLDAETDIIPLKDGRLMAFLRSSTANMHFATSSDNGASWSKVTDIGFKGHSPHVIRLRTGEIVLSHRLPNTSIHISRDEGRTWQGPFEIDNVIGAYPSCVELHDGSVLIVYYSEGKGSEIRAKRFRVTGDGIAMIPWE